MTKKNKCNKSLQDKVASDTMEVLVPIHGDCSSAIESYEEQGHVAPLPVSTKSKKRDGRLVDCGMYSRSLRSLCERSDDVGDEASSDENVNNLPSNTNDYAFDFLPLFPANDVDTELLTFSGFHSEGITQLQCF